MYKSAAQSDPHFVPTRYGRNTDGDGTTYVQPRFQLVYTLYLSPFYKQSNVDAPPAGHAPLRDVAV